MFKKIAKFLKVNSQVVNFVGYGVVAAGAIVASVTGSIVVIVLTAVASALYTALKFASFFATNSADSKEQSLFSANMSVLADAALLFGLSLAGAFFSPIALLLIAINVMFLARELARMLLKGIIKSLFSAFVKTRG